MLSECECYSGPDETLAGSPRPRSFSATTILVFTTGLTAGQGHGLLRGRAVIHSLSLYTFQKNTSLVMTAYYLKAAIILLPVWLISKISKNVKTKRSEDSRFLWWLISVELISTVDMPGPIYVTTCHTKDKSSFGHTIQKSPFWETWRYRRCNKEDCCSSGCDDTQPSE
jgi:hypothetical protein